MANSPALSAFRYGEICTISLRYGVWDRIGEQACAVASNWEAIRAFEADASRSAPPSDFCVATSRDAPPPQSEEHRGKYRFSSILRIPKGGATKSDQLDRFRVQEEDRPRPKDGSTTKMLGHLVDRCAIIWTLYASMRVGFKTVKHENIRSR